MSPSYGTVKIASSDYGFPQRRRLTFRFLLVLLLCAAVLFGGLMDAESWSALAALKQRRPPLNHNGNSTTEFSWEDIKPSRKLQWHSCYDGAYECARLDVPLDWQAPTDSERVVLAISKLRATSSSSSSSSSDVADYKGAVFFNPGGPGGSGIWALQDRGAKLQTIIGTNHDMISWDPRGVGASIPRVDCWGGGGGGGGGGDNSISRRMWDLQDVGVIDAHPGTLNDAFARATAFSRMCEERVARVTPGLLESVSTATHARDLLEILEQTGQRKLRYWGFSYGTVLGGVFASMYPDRVERLVSDGNVDYREWHLGTHINFLRDTDRVMEAFYEYCHSAGPENCAFYAETPDAIRARHVALLEDIRKHPIIIPSNETSGPAMPQFVTWSDVKRMTSTTLYQPVYTFKNYSKIMADLEQRDPRMYYERVRAADAAAPICETETPPPDVPVLLEGTDDAFPAIMCADRGVSTGEETVEEFEKYTNDLMEISTAVGDVLALFRLACIGRAVKPKWRYDGPFEGNTSHPILYVANMADNVSPLVSARNNSQGFPGSVVLVQNSYGHTSLSAPSTCTARYIHAYFQNGTLPAPGTTCEPDYFPFQEVTPDENAEQDDLAAASLGLSNSNWISNMAAMFG